MNNLLLLLKQCVWHKISFKIKEKVEPNNMFNGVCMPIVAISNITPRRTHLSINIYNKLHIEINNIH
ncbi:MAG: hypothetical protein KAH16_01355 [Candidatus Izimaplasma sp.]|nr:hypothetical protein [Candidatus Izimaplasma bacterium]